MTRFADSREDTREADAPLSTVLFHSFAHKGDLAAIFRWREAQFAQEQMHAGHFRTDNSPDLAHEEKLAVDRDLKLLEQAGILRLSEGKLKFVDGGERTKVALVLDYDAGFQLEANPQGGIWELNTFVSPSLPWDSCSIDS